jgi:two-component system, chemotaxis family, protein-glutamate methylesterase/glutaminase
MIRVIIAEDSATVRELLVGILGADSEIEIVGTVKNGLEAVEMTKRLRPDVVTMDVNMPVMDGFEATKRIMIEAPVPVVIISGAVDVGDVTISMNALRAGALTVLEKPSNIGSPKFEESVRHLVSTVKAMAGVKVVRHWRQSAPAGLPAAADVPPLSRIRVIAIAASTGGPAALARVLGELPAQFPVPVLVVQHIARGFVSGLASWLNTTCSLEVKVAEEGDQLIPSTVYLACDDFHMGVSPALRITLDGAPPIGGFRPSATYLFGSVGKIFGASAVAVILTGMGEDGVEGLRALRTVRGQVLVQDQSSSVVFGMPGAAIAAGLADKVLPLSAVGAFLIRMAGKPSLPNNER